MANLTPTPSWPDIVAWDENTVAAGSEMNAPAQALLNRTELLRNYAALPFVDGREYKINERVQLDNGEIVFSTIANNTNNPNSDITGWELGRPSVVLSTADLLSLPNPYTGQRAFVTSLQKWYTYSLGNTAVENGVTVVGDWEMDVQDAYYASWFATPKITTNQATALQLGYDYATSKGRAFIVDGHYYLDGAEIGNEKVAFYIRSDSVLIFKKGVGIFQQIPTNTQGYDVIRIHEGVKNFAIFDPEVIGDRDTHLGTAGEWGYLITLYDCENGYIRAPKVSNAWGDGMYVGRRYAYATAKLPKNILVEDLTVNNCRRNGLSITGGENITFVRPTISRTNGIAPQSGIDIEPEEPENATEISYLKNIRLHDTTLIDNVDHFWVVANKPNRVIDVVFSGTTRFINNGAFPVDDKFSIYKYINALNAQKQSGRIIFDNVLWTTTHADVLFYMNPEVTGIDIIFNNLEFSDNVKTVNIRWLGGVVTGIPWGEIEFRKIRGKGLTRAGQSKYLVNNNANLKVGTILNLPDTVEWVLDDPNQLVNSTDKNICNAWTRFGGFSTDTNQFSTYIKHSVHADIIEPIYLRTATDFRRLKIELSKDIDIIGFGVNINGLSILGSDGNIKTEAHCLTPGGWIEFQNTPGGRTKIFDSYGTWTFS